MCTDLEIPIGLNETKGGLSIDGMPTNESELSDVDGRWIVGLNLTRKKGERRTSFDGKDEDAVEMAA
jgi:hypothetical protein